MLDDQHVEKAAEVTCTLYRCKAEDVEPALAAADGRCRHWTFGPDWACPFHADAGVKPFVMVPASRLPEELERLRARVSDLEDERNGLITDLVRAEEDRDEGRAERDQAREELEQLRRDREC